MGEKRAKRRSKPECIEGLIKYLDQLGAHEAGQKDYNAFSVGKPDVLSSSSLAQHGGFTELLAEARRERRRRRFAAAEP